MSFKETKRRATTPLEDDYRAAGFRGQKQEAGYQAKDFRYDLDLDRLKLYATRLFHACKRICKYQPQINTKKTKEAQCRNYKSKKLGDWESKCQQELTDADDAMTNISETLHYVDEKPKFSRSTRDSSWEDRMWRNKLEAAKAEIDENIALFKSSQDQIACLEKENNGLREENAKLQMRLLELENATRNFQSENASLRRQYQQEKAEKGDALTRYPNRPTKIAEKISELYGNEWTDAFDSLEKSHPQMDAIKTLLNILQKINEQCQQMAWQDFFEHVQSAIELPALVLKDFKSSKSFAYKVVLTKEMKQQIQEFRKHRAPTVLDIIRSTLVSKDLESNDLTAYYNACVDVCWLAAVQDPPMFMNFDTGEKFDTSLFKDYTARGSYVEFLVWPAIHLYKDGPLLSKGVAQGTTIRPTPQQPQSVRQTSPDCVDGKRAEKFRHPLDDC